MIPDYDVIARLRELFLAGATPSRLIEYIARQHAGDSNWPRYVQPYFAAAFSVALLEWENRSPSLPVDEKMASYLNSTVLHEMVGRTHQWKDMIAPPTHGEEAWLDGLTTSPDELSLVDSVHPDRHPSLTESWPSLSVKVRDFVRRAMVNSRSFFEKTQILVRLVEQLQKQVTHLERQVDADAEAKHH